MRLDMQGAGDSVYLIVLIGMAGSLLLCITIILFYIRYQRKFFLQRQQIQQTKLHHQVTLLHATIQSQEKERKRIGRDLHDDVGGALANLHLTICKLNRASIGVDNKNDIANCQHLTNCIIETVRNISHSLSPSGIDIFGLPDAIEELIESRRRSSGLQIVFDNLLGDTSITMPSDTSIALYRVLQELLTNTLKHAEAREVIVSLSYEKGNLLVKYTDDGKGMGSSRPHKGIGMQNIESRLNMIRASYKVDTESKGFCMSVQVPL